MNRYQIVNRAEECSVREPLLAAVATMTGDRWTVRVERFLDDRWKTVFRLVEPADSDRAEAEPTARFPVFQQVHAHHSADGNSALLSLLGQSGGDFFAAAIRFDEAGMVADLHCRSAPSAERCELIWPIANDSSSLAPVDSSRTGRLSDAGFQFGLSSRPPARLESKAHDKKLWLIGRLASDGKAVGCRIAFEFAHRPTGQASFPDESIRFVETHA